MRPHASAVVSAALTAFLAAAFTTVLILCMSSAARAQSASSGTVDAATSEGVRDVALVIQRTGQISYAPQKVGATSKAIVVKSRELASFTRLRAGDRVELAAGARLSIAYLQTGLLEEWRGPTTLVIGRFKSTAIGAADKGLLGVAQVSSVMVARVARAEAALSLLRNRTGAAVVKSIPSPHEDLGKARLERDELRQTQGERTKLPAISYTADLSLVVALIEAEQYSEATAILEALASIQPNDEVIHALLREAKRLAKSDADRSRE